MLVSGVVEKAKEEGCYKLVGDCKDELVGFYGKLGMERREVSNKNIFLENYFLRF